MSKTRSGGRAPVEERRACALSGRCAGAGRLRKEYNECRRELSELNRKYQDDPKKRDAETKELRGRSAELFVKLRPLQARHEPTGWVWLYLQKPTQEASASDSGTKKSGSGSGSGRH